MLKTLGGNDCVERSVGKFKVFGAGHDGDVVCRDHVVAVIVAVIEQKTVVSVNVA